VRVKLDWPIPWRDRDGKVCAYEATHKSAFQRCWNF